jgi:sRNA-binding protein
MTLNLPSETLKTPQEDLKPKKRRISLSPEDIEAKRASFKQFQATKAWLEETFPKAFNFKNPKPLKLGIQHNLLSVTCPFSKGSLRHCLGIYAHSKTYLEAIVQEKWRYDLNGEKAEEVTQDQKDHALKMLVHKKALSEKNKKTKLFRSNP